MPGRGSRRSSQLEPRGIKRRLIAVTAVLLGLLVLAGLFLGYQAVKARQALVLAESQAQTLKSQITTGDVKAAQATLAELRRSTANAQSQTDGPLWGVSSKLPLVGANVEAVQTVARVVNSIASDGLPPIVNVADQIKGDAFSPKNGRVDLAALRKIAPEVDRADTTFASGRRDMEEIEAENLVGPLQAPVTDIQAKLIDAQSVIGAGADAARLMPDMLGGSGSRTYLLVFQNNAEIRSTGGLPGAFAFVKANNGKISIAGQGAAHDLPYFENPVVKLTDGELNTYSKLMANFFGDSNFTPDFPRTAEIMRSMVDRELDKRVDGVISVDPIALSYMLKATGPVKLADGKSITSDNAVKSLLNEPYFAFQDEILQDAYFADAAKRIFDVIAAGKGDPQAVISAMGKAVGENRILISSSKKKEQEILASTRIAGALPRETGATPHVGLYLNDSTETKLEYYLHRESTVRATKCTNNGVQTLRSTTVLTSTAPKNVRTLPASILGPGTGEKPGSMRMNLRFYAPLGGLVTDLKVNGKEETINRGSHDGLNVVIVPVLLAPGQKVTVTTSMFTGEDQRNDAVFATTPGINPTPNNVKVPTACN